MSRQDTLALLNRFNIQPTRSLGQNFLTDDLAISRICDLADLSGQDLVIEIGPGIGSLTRELAHRAGRIVALEIDRHVMPALTHNLDGLTNCLIRQADALSIHLPDLTDGWSGSVKLVANLPYYITTPLMVKILCELPTCQTVVLMIQREAAGRVLAAPGGKQYGPLAILVACYGRASREMVVPAASFYPRPGVDSCVIRINTDRRMQIDAWPDFHRFLENCFTQRRKTLMNSLKTAGWASERQKKLLQWLATCGLAADIRAEMLSPEQFVDLYHHLS